MGPVLVRTEARMIYDILSRQKEMEKLDIHPGSICYADDPGGGAFVFVRLNCDVGWKDLTFWHHGVLGA